MCNIEDQEDQLVSKSTKARYDRSAGVAKAKSAINN